MTDTTNHAMTPERIAKLRNQIGLGPDDACDLLDALAALTRDLQASQAMSDRLKLEAQIQAGEARAHIAIVQECYQIATGATGEPATWNGAEPIRKAFAAQAARIATLEAEARRFYRGDGTYEDLATPEEVIERRKEAAARIATLEAELADAQMAERERIIEILIYGQRENVRAFRYDGDQFWAANEVYLRAAIAPSKGER